MKKKLTSLLIATIVGGFGMWLLAGIWHNLVLPTINENIHPHHEGIGILLVAYFILAFFMSFIYTLVYKGGKPSTEGLKIGVILGIVWVFPHGLAMAGAHNSSILYEIKNTIWHMFEQGIGGIIIAFVFAKFKN